MNIFFEYNGKTISLPINPEELEISRDGNNESVDVVGIGEVNIIKSKKLIPISISSFFPEDKIPNEFIKFFETVQDEKKPMRIIFKEMNLNMQVSIESFKYSIKAGEEKDRYYELEVLEWKNYAPILIKQETKKEETTNQEQSEEQPQEQTKQQEEPQKGDIVKFNGGNHYKSSQANNPTGKPRTCGNAELTLINKGSKHPYHLIGVTGGSDVYGWVDEGSFTK